MLVTQYESLSLIGLVYKIIMTLTCFTNQLGELNKLVSVKDLGQHFTHSTYFCEITSILLSKNYFCKIKETNYHEGAIKNTFLVHLITPTPVPIALSLWIHVLEYSVTSYRHMDVTLPDWGHQGCPLNAMIFTTSWGCRLVLPASPRYKKTLVQTTVGASTCTNAATQPTHEVLTLHH